MKKFIVSPFYSIRDNKLMYLDSCEVCDVPLEESIKDKILIDEGVIFNRVKNTKCDETILVLEPHPDDFVLSALGYAIDKYNFIVLNIFSKTDINNFTWIDKINISSDEYEKIRIEESKIAIEKMLGQVFKSLKLESKRITKKSDKWISKEIISGVKEILNKNSKIKKILIPMGVGKHPDHLIVYDTIINYLTNKRDYQIILYPEYPYARCLKDYNNTLKEIIKKYKIEKITVDIEDKIETLANAISVYRSQFDDINRKQMFAIIREDCRALAHENEQERLTLVYYEIKGGRK